MDNAKEVYINGEWVDPISTETMDVIKSGYGRAHLRHRAGQ